MGQVIQMISHDSNDEQWQAGAEPLPVLQQWFNRFLERNHRVLLQLFSLEYVSYQ